MNGRRTRTAAPAVATLIDGKEAVVIVPSLPGAPAAQQHVNTLPGFVFGARNFDAVLLDVDSTSSVNFVSVARQAVVVVGW